MRSFWTADTLAACSERGSQGDEDCQVSGDVWTEKGDRQWLGINKMKEKKFSNNRTRGAEDREPGPDDRVSAQLEHSWIRRTYLKTKPSGSGSSVSAIFASEPFSLCWFVNACSVGFGSKRFSHSTDALMELPSEIRTLICTWLRSGDLETFSREYLDETGT